jgi:hypothetical protein
MMRESLVLLQAIALLLLLLGISAGADMDFFDSTMEEDTLFWGRQLRRSSMSHGGSMSMPELSCMDESDCDERPCQGAECIAGVCVYTPKVCPFGEFCETQDGVCRPVPPRRQVTDIDCIEASDCVDESFSCPLEECIQGKCVITDPPPCPEDNDGNPCTNEQRGSRCQCNPDNKRCPGDGLVCDSSDGFCKDPIDIN